jgi:hypothetical protein
MSRRDSGGAARIRRDRPQGVDGQNSLLSRGAGCLRLRRDEGADHQRRQLLHPPRGAGGGRARTAPRGGAPSCAPPGRCRIRNPQFPGHPRRVAGGCGGASHRAWRQQPGGGLPARPCSRGSHPAPCAPRTPAQSGGACMVPCLQGSHRRACPAGRRVRYGVLRGPPPRGPHLRAAAGPGRSRSPAPLRLPRPGAPVHAADKMLSHRKADGPCRGTPGRRTPCSRGWPAARAARRPG